MTDRELWIELKTRLGAEAARAVVYLIQRLIEKHKDEMHKKRKPKEPTRFVKPTPDEVTAYGKEIGYQIDGQAFCDFYESKGWMIGKNPMKNWHAAVGTWRKRDDKPVSNPKGCILCGAEGLKYQSDKNGKKVWLCSGHYQAFEAVKQMGDTWGRMTKEQIEQFIRKES